MYEKLSMILNKSVFGRSPSGQAFRTSAFAPFLHSLASLSHSGTPPAVLQSLTRLCPEEKSFPKI